jgi:hypothetical protein
VLSIKAGTHANNNFRGLQVTGKSSCYVSSTTDAIQFNSNSANAGGEGILVDANAFMQLTGTPGVNGAGTVQANGNSKAGVWIAQDASGGLPTQNTVDGLVAWNNGTNTIGDGLHVEGGSNVTVHTSQFLANAIGVHVLASGNGQTAWQYDTSHIFFGSSINNDQGKNTVQGLPAQDGGVSAKNVLAGVCYENLPNKSQTLYVYGNYWVNPNGSAAIDCTQNSPGALSKAANCTGGVDLAGQGQNGNTIGIANCN